MRFSIFAVLVAAVVSPSAAFVRVAHSAHPASKPKPASGGMDSPTALDMKVIHSIGSLKKRSRTCQVVRRRGRTYLIDPKNPRNKARQGGRY